MLADVFEKFKNRCLEDYGLCPSHYLTTPDLSWDTMLSLTKIDLELISDVDMYLFFKKDIRVGAFYISKRYRKANNKYLVLFKRKKMAKYVTYLDKNNFYGYGTSKSLPTG